MRRVTPAGVILSFFFAVPIFTSMSFYSSCTLCLSLLLIRGKLTRYFIRTVVFITQENDVQGIGDRLEKSLKSTMPS